jgi:hypothetical protein
MGLADPKFVHHRDDVGYTVFHGIGWRSVRFVAISMPTCVDQDQHVVALEWIDTADVIPAGQTVSEPMLQDQRLTWNPRFGSECGYRRF